MSEALVPAGDSADELLEVAREAAAAGAAVLARRASLSQEDVTGQADNKSSDNDWVTAFDREAENAVRAVINRLRPHDVITGEEYGTTAPGTPSGYRWSIDPLDGTTNFIRNIVYFGTSVAVAGPAEDGRGERWLAGVVDAPALRRVYWATHGGGAWLLDAASGNPEPRRLSGPPAGARGRIVATGFAYDAVVRAEQAAFVPALLDGLADLRRLGSAALDLCLVADGTHDCYGERGLNEHDWSAGALIAEEAGCWVRRPALPTPLEGGPSDADRLAAWTCAGALEDAGRFPL
ncbi:MULTISPECIES: inositol monophosphatase family protein [Arthrobacter]|uniref:Inositol monophosphatase family protein n=2 Tax=Arthrobacter TaxID=1663 RepID=A0ABU9KNB1_9MICC|nr:inositol monophosphatase family protein [Arthrobacter sp. YJM1]MDP5228323.1 inositol monophosphatase family protein [Arthrobacter sp. YJM1]